MNHLRILPAALFAALMSTLGAGCATSASAEGWPELIVPAEQMKLAKNMRIGVPRRSSSEAMPSGTVVLRVHVDEEGRVRKSSLIESSGNAGLDAAAARSLVDARFVPYTSNGVAVPVTTSLPVHFRASSRCVGGRPLDCA